jgi:GDPmannose 4,6-dehydratase
MRLAGVDFLLGDCTKAKEKLGWKQEVSFEELVKMMVNADLTSKPKEQIILFLILRI